MFMPAPLPVELRKRVVAYAEATGLGRILLGQIFGLGPATAYRWVDQFKRTGSLEPKTVSRRGPAPKIADSHLEELRTLVAEKPDRTLQELCACWLQKTGVDVDETTMHRALVRASISLKKKTKRVIHRERSDVQEAKKVFCAEITKVPDEKLIFIDEMGVNLAMTPTMARAPVGERAFGTVPSMRASNLSVVAAVRHDSVLGWYPYDGAVDEERFLRFIKASVAPSLRTGDVVVMDNVKFHKADEAKAIIESAGARVMFIPAYHPEFNAIEEAFSVVKEAFRRLEPRNIVALVAALTSAFASLTASKLRAFVAHMRTFTIQPA